VLWPRAPLGEELDWEYPFLLLVFIFLCQSLEFFINGTRNPPIDIQRVNWIEHHDKLIAPGHLRRTYRMLSQSFDKLVEIIRPLLTVNATKAFARSPAGPIMPEMRLHCLIHYIAGGSYLDISILVSIPHSTFYYSLRKSCDAINACPGLAFWLPSTEAELRAVSQGFEISSYQGIMRGCIGAIDGWLCVIVAPPSSAVGIMISYVSGHYQWYTFLVDLFALLSLWPLEASLMSTLSNAVACMIFWVACLWDILLLVTTPTHPPSILSQFWGVQIRILLITTIVISTWVKFASALKWHSGWWSISLGYSEAPFELVYIVLVLYCSAWPSYIITCWTSAIVMNHKSVNKNHSYPQLEMMT
jgi:hypothetical protein